VKRFAGFLGRSPDTASVEDLRTYQLHLVDHGMSPISLNATLTGLKFLFATTLDHPELLTKMHAVPVPHKLPVVLSREEVARLLAAVDNRKHQTALAVAYGAGLRVSEVVSLKVSDIDSQRMTLRIEQGKGSKDRYAMLSPVLLERLRTWWKFAHAQGKMLQGGWLFPGLDPHRPARHASTQPGYPCRSRGGGDRQAGIDAYAEAQFRYPLAGTEGGYSDYPGAARSQEVGDHGTVCPGGHRYSA
jgi:integrase